MQRLAATLVASAVLLPGQATQTDPRMHWLAEHAVAIGTADPASGDLADLAPLRELLGDARVVMLGEQSHGDGAAFLLKTRLIRFLHEELGFDVLAFESGLYDCHKAWDSLRAGAEPQQALATGIFPIWMASRQLEPLVGYLGARAKAERPLELCGFDCQLTGSASRDHLAADLREFASGEPAAASAAAVAILAQLPELLDGEPPDAATREAVARAFAELSEGLAGKDVAASRDPRQLAFWRQLTRSLRAFTAYRWREPPKSEPRDLAADFNPRDAQMGENMVWLARERYPGRKIVVWAATMHIARNHDTITTGQPALDYLGLRAMGHHVHAALGAEAFAIGFTAHSGSAGLPWTESRPLAPAPAGSLDDLCARAGLEQALVPLRDAPDWLRQPLTSRPLGHANMRADWSRVLDAMVFQRTMTPSTRRLTEDQRAIAADLRGALQRRWRQLADAQREQHVYADKGTFVPEWEAWLAASDARPEQVATRAAELEQWAATHLEEPGFRWRWLELAARIASDRGDRTAARQHLEAALAAYPTTVHAQPSKHSGFQHLVNSLCLLVWDDAGFEAALARATALLTSDERFHYFYPAPWDTRLKGSKRANDVRALRAAVRDAYEQRAQRFPQHADAARRHARELR